MSTLNEDAVEKLALELLQQQGYELLTADRQGTERGEPSNVLLRRRLEMALANINADLPSQVVAQARQAVIDLPAKDPVAANEKFHKCLVEGIKEAYQKDGHVPNVWVRLIDFDNPRNNDFVVCDQVAVEEGNARKRLDIVLFINGMPLVAMELKNPTSATAGIEQAFNQLQNYKATIPGLFCYNGLLVASDGHEAKAGSLTAEQTRFMAWKTVDGKLASTTTPQIETLIKGMLRPEVLLDLIRHYTVFQDARVTDKKTGVISIRPEKKIAAYHQYYAVQKAVVSTVRAKTEPALATTIKEAPGEYNLPDVEEQEVGDHRAGVVWHTQGSGKSLSMLFYAGKLVDCLDNPTIVVVTDRNDLDDQLFRTFSAGKGLLRQEPKRVMSRLSLRDLLKVKDGGVVFTTLQKFGPREGEEKMEVLSDSSNVIVIADEGHRSHYGFEPKSRVDEEKQTVVTEYGYAQRLRDALPNASMIAFTATPIEKEDASTPAVFGNYIDVYDMVQAVADKATVPIYYESRLAHVHLKEEERQKLDIEIDEIMEGVEDEAVRAVKRKWARQEAIIGHTDRVKEVVADILEHFEERRKVFEGKAMIVATSRRIAVEIYNEIVAARPDWRDEDKDKGEVKVIMTSSSSDPAEWEKHATNKQDRARIGERFKNPEDPLKIVIVRDMWLTGFDAPCLDTMYIDKIMSGHNLMQAIARVNRVYKDKTGGLIVDYIGIAADLKQATATYSKSGGRGSPVLNREDAVNAMLEKHEVVKDLLHGFDYRRFFAADTKAKLTVILEAQEHVLGLDDGKSRFVKQVTLLSKAFALAVPHPRALGIKDEVGFFQAVKARLVKFETERRGASNAEIETAMKQIVSKAITTGEVIDIFDAAGIKKPDISILSDEFLKEVEGMKRRNLAVELLKKILNDEIRNRLRRNLVQGKRFSEMLDAAINKYENNLLTTAQVVRELIRIAREIRSEDERAAEKGLSEAEVAFYDTLIMSESAKKVMEDKVLLDLARILTERVRRNTTLDWVRKDSVKAQLRVMVKQLLKKYGYPPDAQKLATDRILQQAEVQVTAQVEEMADERAETRIEEILRA